MCVCVCVGGGGGGWRIVLNKNQTKYFLAMADCESELVFMDSFRMNGLAVLIQMRTMYIVQSID